MKLNCFELCSVEENGYEALALLSELSGSPKIANELIRPHISDVPTSGDLDVTTLGPLIADMMPEESICLLYTSPSPRD